MTKNVPIAISMGDPCGIGPEVLAKALNQLNRIKDAVFFVVGDAALLRRYGLARPKNLVLVDLKNLDPRRFKPGSPTKDSAAASLAYLATALSFVKKGAASGLVTAPISKESVRGIGFSWPGHTEYLANFFGVRQVEMAFVSGNFRVVLLSRHLSLRQAILEVKKKRIIECATLSYNFLKKNFKIKNPKIAVCGLNPHAGEAGLFGKEEGTEILPALQVLNRKFGAHFFGPLAADSVFHKAFSGVYDLVVAMYHDQGLAPFKTVAFQEGVHLTIGLPIVRTSPVHGTAYDIAGRGIADHHSMASAIRLAYQLVKNSL